MPGCVPLSGAKGVKLKYPLLLLLCAPLILSSLTGNGEGRASAAATFTDDEKPFVLLTTVHNYGYIEPCG